jgi:hypothetical protein
MNPEHKLHSCSVNCCKQAITLKCPAQGHDECNEMLRQQLHSFRPHHVR